MCTGLPLQRLLGSSFLTANCCLSQGPDGAWLNVPQCPLGSSGQLENPVWAIAVCREDLGLPAGRGYTDSEHPVFSDHQLALCPDEP